MALAALLPVCAQGQNTQARDYVHEQSKIYEWPEDPQVVDHLHQWQDLKFGVLMHWGVYSVEGISESWPICGEERFMRDSTKTYQQYKDWYWGLADRLNPTKFNPDQWAAAMKDAGMKYMLFTTKHHDGFCMYDTKYTDFSIAHHAFKDNPKRDVLKYIFDSFRKQNFMIGAYFSKPDWHCQYYWWDALPIKNGRNVNYDITKRPWRWQQFKQYTYNQIHEILSNYGKVDILWLDGGWVNKANNQDIDMPHIAEMARKDQPGLIMVDRTIHGPYENYQTPERRVPKEQLPYPWESCIPLSNNWGWSKHPKWKSPEKVINTLIEIVAKGGNLALGIGPTPEGLIEPEVVKRLKAIGDWLKANGKAIYATTITPHYHDGNVWFTAAKDKKTLYAIYMHQKDEVLPATLSWSENLPKGSVRLVATGKSLKTKVRSGVVTVDLPAGMKAQSFAMEFKIK